MKRECLLFDSATIGSVNDRLYQKRVKITMPQKPKKGRHVIWKAIDDYVCVKRGIHLKNELDIETKFHEGTLTEEHLFIYKHKNSADMERNAALPVYEGVYFCTDNGVFFRSQKCHLKAIYSKKNNGKLAWTVDEQGIPYWVDRFLMTKK